MSGAAYVDSSCVVAIAFGEPGATALARRLRSYDELVASDLLQAELHSAFAREGVPPPPALTAALSWIIPDRPLRPEIEKVLAAGYVRGADCWHLATALYVAADPAALSFLTLGAQQGEVARALGFRK